MQRTLLESLLETGLSSELLRNVANVAGMRAAKAAASGEKATAQVLGDQYRKFKGAATKRPSAITAGSELKNIPDAVARDKAGRRAKRVPFNAARRQRLSGGEPTMSAPGPREDVI